MMNYRNITPEGTHDFLSAECRATQQLECALSGVFSEAGYVPVATPELEFHDLFCRASAGWLAEQFYATTDTKGRLLVMRPDSTLPIARVAGSRLRDAALPLRLYYHQKVFRRSHVYHGHSDEVRQSGVELLGAAGLRADLEVLVLASEALAACHSSARLELGSVVLIQICLAELQKEFPEAQPLLDELQFALECKNTPALQELLRPFHHEHPTVRALLALPRLFGGTEVLSAAPELTRFPAAAAELAYLQRLCDQLKELGREVTIDLGLTRGHQYYTGLVFQGYHAGQIVLSGGRYDHLLEEFGHAAPAVGFALELEPFTKEILLDTNPIKIPDCLVFGTEGQEAAALRYAQEQRAAGHVCEISLHDSLEQALAYAETQKIPLVLFMTESGVIQEKHLKNF